MQNSSNWCQQAQSHYSGIGIRFYTSRVRVTKSALWGHLLQSYRNQIHKFPLSTHLSLTMNHSLPAFSCACSHYLFRFLSFGGVLAEDILQFVHIAGGGLKLAQNLSHGHCLRRLELLNLINNRRFKKYEEERGLNL